MNLNFFLKMLRNKFEVGDLVKHGKVQDITSIVLVEWENSASAFCVCIVNHGKQISIGDCQTIFFQT